jgi:hypothetical protein
MFGIHYSEQKKLFIEEEFRKRQHKRRRDPDSNDDSGQGDDAYAAFFNKPEFARAVTDLIAQKGLGEFANDIPMLLESFKQMLSPENFRTLFQVEGQGEEQGPMQEDVPYNSIPTALPEARTRRHVKMLDVEYTSATKLDVSTPAVPLMSIHPELRYALPPRLHSIPTTAAPIPRLNIAEKKSTSARKVATPPPAPAPPLIPSPAPEAMPVAPIPTVSNLIQPPPPPPPPPQDRIRAFGFPPMMQSR